jgi:hypothetical protein
MNEVKTLIDQLVRVSEEQRSHIWLGYAYLFKAKLAVIEVNFDDARRFFTQAQQIAEMHGLDLLARSISAEHDIFLNELEKWKAFKESKPPISERFDLSSLEATIDIILQRRVIKPPELIDEISVLLLIISEGGMTVFSYYFTEEFSFEDEFISNFLTALNMFSEEVFSKGLDRAKWGEFVLIMDSIGPYTVYYLFKGQSYLAKQKLIHFAHRVQNTASIWNALKNFQKTHQVIELSDNPSLESLITEIFIKKSPEISTSN